MTDTTENMTEEEIVVDLNTAPSETSGTLFRNDTQHEETKHQEETKEQNEEPKQNIVPAKRIDELTDQDKQILINNARNGIDNPYYDVKLFKNGSTRICKKKKPTVSKQAVMFNGERTIKNQDKEQKVYMTDNQLIWEHLFELENKYNNLYRKHKKLKGRYNDLYVEDEVPSFQQPIMAQRIEEPNVQETSMEEEPVQNNPLPQQQYIPRGNWRTSLMQNRNFYIN